MSYKLLRFSFATKMHYPDYLERHEDMEEDVEEVRERMTQLSPHVLLNRFLAMNKIPEMHQTFAHLGPLIKKLTLSDNGPDRNKFNARAGKEAGRLLVEYCNNGTIQNKGLKVGFSIYDNERKNVFQLAKYLKNLKTLDCFKVRENYRTFSVQQITQYCPKLERLNVVANYIDCDYLEVGRIFPEHSALKKIKIELQSYSSGDIIRRISKIGKRIKEKLPNLSSIEMEIGIDASCENWNFVQEEEFLGRFHENNDMYRHFKEMDKLKRCIFSYSYHYERVATLEVKLK